ncbi:sulfotransferase domain-containing protein [Gammaproteobacteria bacterium]|nr:sulfotransferase domain-containing protein [Gammaproteobacteria bacterium]
MLFIHLGLPKAASTTLQEHLFAKHSQIEYLGKGHSWPEFTKLINSDQDVSFEMLRCTVDKIAEPAMRNGRVPVLSRPKLVYCNHSQLAINIERAFGPCKIILVVRHPVRWIESLYLERLRANNIRPNRIPPKLTGYFTLESYLEHIFSQKNKSRLKCVMSRSILEPYVMHLGKQNVRVFMLEQLQSDPQSFIAAISRFIGVDPTEGIRCAAGKREHKRLTHNQVERIKEIHRSPDFTKSLRLAKLPDRCRMLGPKNRHQLPAEHELATVEFPERWKTQIEDLARDDCNYLRQEWGLPVDEAGYPL